MQTCGQRAPQAVAETLVLFVRAEVGEGHHGDGRDLLHWRRWLRVIDSFRRFGNAGRNRINDYGAFETKIISQYCERAT